MTRISPLHNNLVVEEHALGGITKTGLFMPDIARASAPYRFATVLEVGPGRIAGDGRIVACSCKVGDTIAFAKNAGVEFPLEDDRGVEKVYRLINEQYVLGIMHDMPVVSSFTGLDGQLLRMQPGSRAPSDNAVENLDRLERAAKQGIIDTAGNTLDLMREMDADDEASS